MHDWRFRADQIVAHQGLGSPWAPGCASGEEPMARTRVLILCTINPKLTHTPIENIIGVGGFVLAHVIYEWLPHLVLHKEYISAGESSNYYQCQLIFH